MTVSEAHQDHGLEPRVFEFVGEILLSQGWAEGSAENLVLTDAGRTAASLAMQYYYPVSYLPTLRAIPQLLFGAENVSCPSAAGSDEHHVDRLLDVQFSGLVFEHRCKEPFLDMVLPLFDREPAGEQPECIVDTGSGNGTLLVALYRAIRERTLRGRMLRDHPLKLVGVEYTRIALEATKQALQALGVPHLVVYGDIADPSGISRKLSEHGIDPYSVLHVSKSVIHNRRYKPPANSSRRDQWQPLSQAPFVSEDGSLIAARDMECNLVEFFEDWIPFTRKHGMFVIEAHTVDPVVTSRYIGRNIVTCMDATHGFSHQYLVEGEVFLKTALTAGYQCRARRVLAGLSPNHPLLMIQHFMPADVMNSEISFKAPSES